jgi:hypothetical protein
MHNLNFEYLYISIIDEIIEQMEDQLCYLNHCCAFFAGDLGDPWTCGQYNHTDGMDTSHLRVSIGYVF